MDEQMPVVMHAIRVPIAYGHCESCGVQVAYNLAAHICQHTEPTDCTDPYPARKEKP